MNADQVLKEIADFLTEHRHDLRDARDAATQQLQAEPGNGIAIEKLRVLGILQNLQAELARTTADVKPATEKERAAGVAAARQ